MATTANRQGRAKIRTMGILKLYVPDRDRPTVRAFKKLAALRETSVSALVLEFMKTTLAADGSKL